MNYNSCAAHSEIRFCGETVLGRKQVEFMHVRGRKREEEYMCVGRRVAFISVCV